MKKQMNEKQGEKKWERPTLVGELERIVNRVFLVEAHKVVLLLHHHAEPLLQAVLTDLSMIQDIQ
jgi:hypothetical protein